MKEACKTTKKNCSKMRYKLLTLILLFSCPVLIYAQKTGTIEGSIIDMETNKPVDVVNAELIKASDSTFVKGTITNADGIYKLDDIDLGSYIIRFSYLGYHDKFLPEFKLTAKNPNVKFSQTAILKSSKEIDEVVVTGHGLTGRIEDDKTIYLVSKEAANISSSGLELLRQVPECHVDYFSENVTLEGSEKILFLVNGKRVDKEYLTQINPHIIQKIEIITNPGVKYDSDIEGVINIIFKKNQGSGTGARLAVESPIDNTSYFAKINGNLDFYRNGLRLFVGGYSGFNRFTNFRNNERHKFNDEEQISILKHNVNGVYNNQWGRINYGADWFIDDNNLFSFSGHIKPKFPHKQRFHSLDSLTYLTSNETEVTRNYNERNFHFMGGSYSLFYLHKFSKPGHEISSELYFNNENNHEKQENSDYVILDVNGNDSLLEETIQITDNNDNIIRYQVDYKYPITEKFILSTGLKGYASFRNNEYKEITEEFETSLDYDEKRYAGYTNLSYKYKKVNFQAGLRYEQSDVDISYSSMDTTGSYYELLPFLSAQTKIGKIHNIRLNYRKSIQRPGMTQINPYNIKSNTYDLTSGNPDLEAGNNHKFELTYRMQLPKSMYMSLKPYVKIKNDGIKRILRSSNDSSATVISRFENVSHQLEYGINFSGKIVLTKWWSIMSNVNYAHTDIDEMSEYEIPALSKDFWRYNISTEFKLPKNWMIFARYWNQSPYYSHQSVRESDYGSVLGFNKRINEHWNVSMFTFKPWEHRYYFNRGTVKSNNSVEYKEEYGTYNYFTHFKITYTFNKGEKIKKARNNGNTDDSGENGGGLF